jgi:hypothetical protein
MDETYRMLGREHQANLEREARNWQRADEARKSRPAHADSADTTRRAETAGRPARGRIAAFLLRAARAER